LAGSISIAFERLSIIQLFLGPSLRYPSSWSLLLKYKQLLR
jgi:hypothetical protein